MPSPASPTIQEEYQELLASDPRPLLYQRAILEATVGVRWSLSYWTLQSICQQASLGISRGFSCQVLDAALEALVNRGDLHSYVSAGTTYYVGSPIPCY